MLCLSCFVVKDSFSKKKKIRQIYVFVGMHMCVRNNVTSGLLCAKSSPVHFPNIILFIPPNNFMKDGHYSHITS